MRSSASLITNDVLVIATLPHGAAPAGMFIDATRGERLEPPHDFGNAAARLRLIGEDDDSVYMVRHDNERVKINATVMRCAISWPAFVAPGRV